MSLTCPRCLTPIDSDGPVVYVGAEQRVLHRSCYERRGTKAELSDAQVGPGAQALGASPMPPVKGSARAAGDDSGALGGLVGWLRRNRRTLVGP